MKVLIVESCKELATVWGRHLERLGAEVAQAHDADSAIDLIRKEDFDVLVLNLVLDEGSALAVSDFVEYRSPGTSVIFVTDTTFFSDGSIFSMTSNARALVRSGAPPEDIAAMVEHYATHAMDRAAPLATGR
ncbi:response regulator [Ponticoccus sp. SC2-23]|nr:response regulator [Alexandriicola marinus]MBM1221958.1 response regulator [Ponticoccus sp. SC6-9]MBM1226309.1 response regulator [Ponticoccus sp. SC6-15]MBM1230905.1 response regulator [Ponticoccus sp. SC6-38]MBM1235254.1 response regulator [Ponticoccus sp. SC6-45]MBM1239927.1 response regulator [Ponticoccus sp. SC6-49]MBM1244071.1 response regulator [Ponticoccus sp. SC2-64]MBM1248778.1 response regulator [Ponticoccus sp. SC6-42]MBM1253582.1 response regulator [Ponticoccus sp. SC6-33]M